jgi:hypothetical protein
MSYLVLDIETIPDFKIWTPGPKKPRAKTDPADAFAPLYAHRPIAVGIGMLDDNLNIMSLGCFGTSQFGDDERALLQAVSNGITTVLASNAPTIVTFAGRRFDLPVLALRSLRQALPAAWYSNEMRKRYLEVHHLDLFDSLTESGAFGQSGFSLDTFCRIIGLPGKAGFDGSVVKAAFERGEITKVESYCCVDVARTAFLLIRYLMMRGRITREMFQTATHALWEKCTGELQLGGAFLGTDMNVLMGV